MKVGVLALQGAFVEHVRALQRVGAVAFEVRTPDELSKADALVIPGGESTVMDKLLHSSGLWEDLVARAGRDLPVMGTCAGLILCANRVLGALEGQRNLGILDVTVRRNAYGRQIHSFEADLEAPVLGSGRFRGVFIRAPAIESYGDDVEVVARLGEKPVGVVQGRVLGLAFHPELTGDDRFHRYFVETVCSGDDQRSPDPPLPVLGEPSPSPGPGS